MKVSACASATLPLRYNLKALNFGTIVCRTPAWRFVLFLVVLSPGQAQLDLHTCKVRNIEAKCGSFTVPENRAEPHGRSIRLSVEVLTRAAQTGDSEPLFMLAGGPGGSATELAGFAAESLALVRSAHDIVLMDQRGTGASNGLACPLSEGALFRPRDPAACLTRLSTHADLRYYTTLVFVQDLDDLRATLGYRRIDLYGASYGTRGAQMYLRRYPDRVRALVLASGVPMSEILPDNLGANARRAYQLLTEDCAVDPPCHAGFPNFAAELQSVRKSLSPDQLLGLHLLLYSSATARRVPWLVHEAARGLPQALEREIAQMREILAGQLTIGLHLAVVCSEDLPFSRHPKPVDPVGASFDSQYAALCRDWPRGEVPADFRAPFHSDVPALIVSGDRDPVTPPEDAAAIARSFGHAKVVTVPGSSHLLDGFDGCVNRIIARFLDGMPVQTDCVDSLHPTPFYLGR